MRTDNAEPRGEALAEVLVEVALQRAWLHDDPASYRAGVLALRDCLQQDADGTGTVGDPLAATG